MEKMEHLFLNGAGLAHRGCRKIKAKVKSTAHLAATVVAGMPEEHSTVDVDGDIMVEQDQHPAGSYTNVGDKNLTRHQAADTPGYTAGVKGQVDGIVHYAAEIDAGEDVGIAKGNSIDAKAEYLCTASEQQLLAHLINGVYSRDRGAKDFPLKYLEATYDENETTETYAKHWTRLEDVELEEEKKVGLKHYLWPNSTDQTSPPFNRRCCKNRLRYRLVIALRGTKLSSFRDLVDDIKVAHHTLHCSSRFKATNKLIEQIISVFKEQHGGRDDQICITGHSLGAAIALFLGKELAKENRYHVHCFNPPLLSVLTIIQKCLRVHSFKDKLRRVDMLKPLLKAASRAKDYTKAALVLALGDRNRLFEETVHFVKILDWKPVLYVNKGDLICKEYHRFYDWKQNTVLCPTVMPIETQAMLSRIVRRNAKYSSLVPSLQMNIRTSSMSKDIDNLSKNHKLTAWFEAAPLDSKEFQLLGSNRLPLDDPRILKIMQDAVGQAVKAFGTTTSLQLGQMATTLGRSIGAAALDLVHPQQIEQDSDDDSTKEHSDDAEDSDDSGEDWDEVD